MENRPVQKNIKKPPSRFFLTVLLLLFAIGSAMPLYAEFKRLIKNNHEYALVMSDPVNASATAKNPVTMKRSDSEGRTHIWYNADFVYTAPDGAYTKTISSGNAIVENTIASIVYYKKDPALAHLAGTQPERYTNLICGASIAFLLFIAAMFLVWRGDTPHRKTKPRAL